MATRTSRKWWLLVPVVLLVAAALAVQPVVDWQTRKLFAVFEGYTTSYESARLQLTKLDYRLSGVKIVKESAGGQKEPFVSWESLELGIDWRELLHGRLVARVELVNPRLQLISAKSKAQQQLDPEIPDLAAKLTALVPLKIARIAVKGAEVHFVDKTEPDFPRVWLHDLDATVENLATRAALEKGEATILALSATAQKSAQVTAWVSADPLSKGLFFSGRFRVADLALSEFKDLLASESGLQFDRGTLEVFAEFNCRAGTLSGGVKPVIKNGHVVQGKPGLKNLVKAVFADKALNLFSDRVEGRNAVATVIPISGQITGPALQVWPAVIGVVRNAFVQGVSESFAHVPPPQAGSSDGALPQLVKGLQKGAGPPKAQPQKPSPQGKGKGSP